MRVPRSVLSAQQEFFEVHHVEHAHDGGLDVDELELDAVLLRELEGANHDARTRAVHEPHGGQVYREAAASAEFGEMNLGEFPSFSSHDAAAKVLCSRNRFCNISQRVY